ncbi:uncharacterized protein VTP21DRAFT_11573 [Calcarisporiella thermophila]|uniref:uncharacterized protein n=1 Tax=Calcarisporiella thermophila TaxID=911321 RepID=UPI0037430C43
MSTAHKSFLHLRPFSRQFTFGARISFRLQSDHPSTTTQEIRIESDQEFYRIKRTLDEVKIKLGVPNTYETVIRGDVLENSSNRDISPSDINITELRKIHALLTNTAQEIAWLLADVRSAKINSNGIRRLSVNPSTDTIWTEPIRWVVSGDSEGMIDINREIKNAPDSMDKAKKLYE